MEDEVKWIYFICLIKGLFVLLKIEIMGIWILKTSYEIFFVYNWKCWISESKWHICNDRKIFFDGSSNNK